MKLRQTKTIWLGLLCIGVLGYLLMLGQINIRQFEAKLIQRAQENLLQRAYAAQRHFDDLLSLLSDYLQSMAAQTHQPGQTLNDTAQTPHLAVPLLDSAVLSLKRVDNYEFTTNQPQNAAHEGLSSPSSTADAAKALSLPKTPRLTIDMQSDPPSLVMIHPLKEHTTAAGALVLRLSVQDLLNRLTSNTTDLDTRLCLVSGDGRVIAARCEQADRLSEPHWPHQLHGAYLLDDIRHQRGGIGILCLDDDKPAAQSRYLVGQSPLDGVAAPWAIASIQSEQAIQTAVVEHARGIQLGMVCLFMAVSLIWLLYWRTARRRIVIEQQIALGQATVELHHVSEQSRKLQQHYQRQIAFYRAILNAVPMSLYWKDSEGRLLGYNDPYAHIAGCEPMDYGPVPSDSEVFEQQQEGLPLDMEVMDKDIELLFLPQTYGKDNYWVSKIPLKDKAGRVIGLLGGLLKEDHLKNSQQQRFCTALNSHCVTESMPIPALLINRKGYVLHANAAFWKRFEKNQPSTVCKVTDLLDLNPPDLFEQQIHNFTKTPRLHEQTFSLGLGENCYWTITYPIYENSKLKGLLALLTDVSELKQTQQHLEKVLDKYRRLLSDLQEQFDRLSKTADAMLNAAEPQAHLDELKSGIDACLESLSRSAIAPTQTTHTPAASVPVAESSSSHSSKHSNPQETTDMPTDDRDIEPDKNRPTPRILLVDDVPENLTLLEIILSRLGMTTVQCTGGQEAVSLCQKEHFDLILMDIQMPDRNGLEAIRGIRADGLNTATTIIAMTASNEKDDELAALEAGCSDCLNKPIDRNLLEQKVRRCVSKKQQMLDAEKGLEITSFLEGDPDYHKTIETFIHNLPGRIEQIRQALNKNDFEELAAKIHALKGLGGFAVYTEKTAQLEENLREQNVDKIQAQIDEMVQLCMHTKIKTDNK